MDSVFFLKGGIFPTFFRVGIFLDLVRQGLEVIDTVLYSPIFLKIIKNSH